MAYEVLRTTLRLTSDQYIDGKRITALFGGRPDG
jgi:hypothetical protein